MLSDIRFTLRLLARNPGTTIAAIVALGFGIGLATAIFNAFSATMLRPFPQIRDEDRLVFLNSQQLSQPDNLYELSPLDFLDLREQSKTLEGLTTAQGRTMIFTGGDVPERVLGASISVEGFAMLGVQPLRGRVFTPDDGKPAATPVAILSHALWQRRFGGDDDVVGRVETVNGKPTTIIGVLPAGFNFPDRNEMWVPFVHNHEPGDRGSHFLPGWARLRPGVTLDEARAEVAAIGARLAIAYPGTNEGKGLVVRPVREEATQDVAVLMRLMLGAAIFVLLIACANIANLLLARAAGRTHEISIRVSVGATAFRIARQMLTESLILGILGGAFGLLVGVWANHLLLAAVPDVEIPFWMTFGFDWRVFGFAAAAAVGSSLLVGILPALQASRATALQLKEGSRGSTGGRPARIARQSLVVAQVALSTVLLIGAGLFVRSFLKLQSTPPGYDADGVLTFRVGLPPTQFGDRDEIRRFFDELTPRLAQVPGVEAAGWVSMLPGMGNNISSFLVEGRAEPRSIKDSDSAVSRTATAGYFAAMRIPLLRGRMFNSGDTRSTDRVAVVDQSFADRWFPGEDPVGRRFTYSMIDEKERVWITIVGIVADVPQQLDRPYDRGSIYVAGEQADHSFVSYAVRVAGDPTTYGPALQRAVVDVKPGIPIYNVNTMRYVHDLAYWERGFFGQVFSAFGLGALFLAALGVYGVMAYNVSQRTAEIGVRMALGASERDVLHLIGRQGLVLVALGLGAGLCAALMLTRFMAVLLFGISPGDPPTYFALSTTLAAVGTLACWFPARRATRVEPMAALRSE